MSQPPQSGGWLQWLVGASNPRYNGLTSGRRTCRAPWEAMMILLNYSHPLTEPQYQELQMRTHTSIEVRNIATNINRNQPLAQVAASLVDQARLSGTEWQTTPLLLNPPGLAPLALALIAEIHGRTGYFVPIVNLRPSAGQAVTSFEVAEIVNLQAVRDESRKQRHTI